MEYPGTRFRSKSGPGFRRGWRVLAHRFATSCVNMFGDRPYWRDVGTIDAYWEANLDLVRVTPDLNLYDESWPLWSYQEQLPPAKFVFDDADRRRFLVPERGVTLITPQMLGQEIHHLL